jgi:hypothetical protein
MNYFAHGRSFVDDPYFLAGTAVPDWLSVVDRGMRAKSKSAKPYLNHQDNRVAALAAGIVRHHHDDRWFHRTRSFVELSFQFTEVVRGVLPGDDGFRPSFLGHVLVELLLDAELIAEAPARLDAYYVALDQIDAPFVADTVNSMATRQSERLAGFIPLFCAERFLYDYGDDGKLLRRLNHVMRRLKLPLLPDQFLDILPGARQRVRGRRGELLAGLDDHRNEQEKET